MNNILVVGNGFDVAHGLATSYNLFLKTIKNWESVFGSIRRRETVNQDGNSETYYACIPDIDIKNLTKLNSIIIKNSWIKYFCQCEAEIDKWIDFEREIYPVIEVFDLIINSNHTTSGRSGQNIRAYISKSIFSPKLLRVANLWGKYVDDSIGGGNICVKEPYASLQYGILKKKLLEELIQEFDEFIEAFELYLHEFVYKRTDVNTLKQIKEIEIDYVVSFNYTLTEKLYKIQDENVHHIHGKIREDLLIGKNDMVLGVNEQLNKSMDFIYFVKYFQRIQKNTGIKYKNFANMKRTTVKGITVKEPYTLWIYGHSLDETDGDILKYLIGDVNSDGKYVLRADKVVFFYYSQIDFEQKVINLIKLYGRSIVEEYIERGKFEFVQTSNEVY